MFFVRIAGAAALFAAAMSTSGAQAATNIECMDSGYSPENQRMIDDYISGFSVASISQGDIPEDLVSVLADKSGQCADENDWSPDAIELALFYKIYAVMGDGLVAHSPFTGAQWKRVRAVYASADHARLKAMITPILDAALAYEAAPDFTDDEYFYLGRLMMKTGVPVSEANQEFFGSWLAAQVTTELLEERFADS